MSKEYKKIARYNYKNDLEEQFISAAILDLRYGITTYVYKQNILDRLKEIFNDLDITKGEFYWTVRNKESLEIRKRRIRRW